MEAEEALDDGIILTAVNQTIAEHTSREDLNTFHGISESMADGISFIAFEAIEDAVKDGGPDAGLKAVARTLGLGMTLGVKLYRHRTGEELIEPEVELSTEGEDDVGSDEGGIDIETTPSDEGSIGETD